LKQQQRRYRQVGFVNKVGFGILEPVKCIAGLNVASKTLGAEFNEMTAMHAHPLAATTRGLNVLRGDKSEICDHEVFSLKNLKRFSVFFSPVAIPMRCAFDSGKVFVKNGG
jgi:hypothetical protein